MPDLLTAAKARELADDLHTVNAAYPLMTARETVLALGAHADALDAGRVVLLSRETWKAEQDAWEAKACRDVAIYAEQVKAMRSALSRIAVAVGLTADAGHEDVADAAEKKMRFLAGRDLELCEVENAIYWLMSPRENGMEVDGKKPHEVVTELDGLLLREILDGQELEEQRDRFRAQRDALVPVAQRGLDAHAEFVAQWRADFGDEPPQVMDTTAALAALDAIAQEGA